LKENRESPCNGTCKIDNDTKICKGCYRTIDEIVSWPELSNSDKEIINILVEKRKKIIKEYKEKKLPVLEWVS